MARRVEIEGINGDFVIAILHEHGLLTDDEYDKMYEYWRQKLFGFNAMMDGYCVSWNRRHDDLYDIVFLSNKTEDTYKPAKSGCNSIW